MYLQQNIFNRAFVRAGRSTNILPSQILFRCAQLAKKFSVHIIVQLLCTDVRTSADVFQFGFITIVEIHSCKFFWTRFNFIVSFSSLGMADYQR